MNRMSSPGRVQSRTGCEFAERVLLEIPKEKSKQRFCGSRRIPPLSPQDCVQLNQYKLKDEIGKVNICWI